MEVAIILPVVLLLLLAVAEMGHALYQFNTLDKALRDGARYLSDNALNGSTGVIDPNGISSTLQTATQNLVVFGNITGTDGDGQALTPLLPGFTTSDVTVAATDATHIQVSAAYVYQPIIPLIPTFGLGAGGIDATKTFNASVKMRALSPPAS